MLPIAEYAITTYDHARLQQLREKLARAKDEQQLDEQTAREYCATWEEYDAVVTQG